jgi:hypothetical protein
MTMKLPDSLKAAGSLGGKFDMQMTAMTDGHRVAMEMIPNISMPMMAGMRMKYVFAIGGDTMHVGILLPPEMAAATGGGSGMRMDMPMSMMGAGNPLLGSIMDSIRKAMTDSLGKGMPQPLYRSLGISSIVAGLRCQEWEALAMGDTTRVCVIPTPPALVALLAQFKMVTGLQSMMAQFPGMAEMEEQAFGGQRMTAIRMVMAKSGMRMELTNFTPGVPDAALMELPDGLQPMPMPAMPIKPGGSDRQR